MSEHDEFTQHGLDLLRLGRRALSHSRYLGTFEGSEREAELKARGALGLLRSALDWLEDTDYREEAHLELDAAGRHVRETFGCRVPYREGRYWEECPVALAHTRIGLSTGFVEREVECSICHEDYNACPHVRGLTYDGQRCVRILKRLDLLEVSLVSRPENPECRIMKNSLSMEKLAECIGPKFEVGMKLSCDRCLSECDGLVEVNAVTPNHAAGRGTLLMHDPEEAVSAGEATARIM